MYLNFSFQNLRLLILTEFSFLLYGWDLLHCCRLMFPGVGIVYYISVCLFLYSGEPV